MFAINSIKNVLKRLCIIFLILSFFNIKSQSYIFKVDSLLEASHVDKNKGDFKKFFTDQNTILKYSKKNNYSKGIAITNHNIGYCYQMFGDCGKALSFYNIALKEEYTKDDLSLQSDINCSIGNCYRQQYLYDEALEKYRNAIRIGERSNGDISFIKALNYINIGSLYSISKNPSDSSYYYLSKAFYYSKHFSKSKRIGGKKNIAPIICISLGQYWRVNKRIDSASHYFLKGIELSKEGKNIMHQAALEFRIGELYLDDLKYKEADYYLEKSKVTFEQKRDITTLPYVYTALSKLNKTVGNNEKHAKYQDLLIKLNLQISETDNASRTAIVDNIKKEKADIFKKKESKLYLIISVVIVLAILIYLIIYWFHQNMKRKKESIISDSVLRLAEKRKIIEQKEREAQGLQRQINDSFDEVVRLAKDNSPEFLTRFQQVYPEYYQKLNSIEPKLLVTEVKLCAMIYLGFSTKNIAEFTFVTIKAAQHRKFRLRKKLNIPSDADINTWLEDMSRTFSSSK